MSVGRRDIQMLDRLTIVACFGRESHADVERAIAVEELCHGTTTNGGLQRIGRVRDGNALTAHRRTIEVDAELRLPELLLDANVRCATYPGDHALDVDGFLLKHGEVG